MRPKDLFTALLLYLKHGENIMLVGGPGVGKTFLVKQAVQALGYDLLLMHPVLKDPTDIKGLPGIFEGSAHFFPFGDIQRLITAESPLVCFIDDLGQATPAMQAAFMQLLWGGNIDGVQISPHVRFVAATNRRTDMAGVSGILEPVKSRFTSILEFTVHPEDWINWAIENNMPPEIIAYISYMSGDLVSSDPPTRDMVNTPCPRTWAALGRLMSYGLLSRLTNDPEDLDKEILERIYSYEYGMVAGTIGSATAAKFLGFIRTYKRLPNLQEVLNNPLTHPPVGSLGEVDVQYAFSAAIAQKVGRNQEEFYRFGDALITFITRGLPKEMQILTMQLLKSHLSLWGDPIRLLCTLPQYSLWSKENVNVILDNGNKERR